MEAEVCSNCDWGWWLIREALGNDERVCDVGVIIDADDDLNGIDFNIWRNFPTGRSFWLLLLFCLKMENDDRKVPKKVRKLSELRIIYDLLLKTVAINLSNSFSPLTINRSSELIALLLLLLFKLILVFMLALLIRLLPMLLIVLLNFCYFYSYF